MMECQLAEGDARYDCETCTAQLKKDRGCEGGVQWQSKYKSDLWCDHCPEKLFTPDVVWNINVWNKTKRHGLPFDGGWANQPAVLINMIDTLNSEHDRIMNQYYREKRDK